MARLPSSEHLPPAEGRPGPEADARAAWTLTIESDDGAARSLRLEAAAYVIGRAEGSDVCLDDRNVSREHATLVRDDAGAWWVEDASSYNGTYVNGRLARGRVALASGACVQVGDVVMTLRSDDGARASGGGFLSKRLALDELPDRLVLVQGPEAGRLLRLDRGPVTIGGHPSCSLRLDEPGCEAIEVTFRPLAKGSFEVVRVAGPVRVYVSVKTYERRPLWNNDLVLLEHEDGRVLCEVRFRARAKREATLPGTPLPVAADGSDRPPSWQQWLLPPTSPAQASQEAEAGRANRTVVLDDEVVRQALAAFVERTAPPAVGEAAPEPTPPVDSAPRSAGEAPPAVDGPPDGAEPPPRSGPVGRRARWPAAAAVVALAASAAGVWFGTRPAEGPSPASSSVVGVPRAAESAARVASAALSAVPVPDPLAPTTGPRAEAPSPARVAGEDVADARPKRASSPRSSRPDKVRGEAGRGGGLEPSGDAPEAETHERARLDAKARNGTASLQELRLLRELCSARGDTACRDRARALIAQMRDREKENEP